MRRCPGTENDSLTSDSLFHGELTVFQEKKGYRFSLDAVLLAGMTRVRSNDRVVDLGTGCAVIPLILAYRGQGRELVGVEIQPELASLASRNVEANRMGGRVCILEADLRLVAHHFEPESFDLVLSNPPYRRLDSGRINPHPQRALARHELKASVEDVFTAGRYLLPRSGALALIYPASRLDHLMVTARRHGFGPKELTVIHSNPSAQGSLVHLECRKGCGEELRVMPPLFVRSQDGSYTPAMRKMYERQAEPSY